MLSHCAVDSRTLNFKGAKVVLSGPPPFPLSIGEIGERVMDYAKKVGAMDSRNIDCPRYAVDLHHSAFPNEFRLYTEDSLIWALRRTLLRQCIGFEIRAGLVERCPLSRSPRVIAQGRVAGVTIDHVVFRDISMTHADGRVFMRLTERAGEHQKTLHMRKIDYVAVNWAAGCTPLSS